MSESEKTVEELGEESLAYVNARRADASENEKRLANYAMNLRTAIREALGHLRAGTPNTQAYEALSKAIPRADPTTGR
jgi:hypothetical protein